MDFNLQQIEQQQQARRGRGRGRGRPNLPQQQIPQQFSSGNARGAFSQQSQGPHQSSASQGDRFSAPRGNFPPPQRSHPSSYNQTQPNIRQNRPPVNMSARDPNYEAPQLNFNRGDYHEIPPHQHRGRGKQYASGQVHSYNRESQYNSNFREQHGQEHDSQPRNRGRGNFSHRGTEQISNQGGQSYESPHPNRRNYDREREQALQIQHRGQSQQANRDFSGNHRGRQLKNRLQLRQDDFTKRDHLNEPYQQSSSSKPHVFNRIERSHNQGDTGQQRGRQRGGRGADRGRGRIERGRPDRQGQNEGRNPTRQRSNDRDRNQGGRGGRSRGSFRQNRGQKRQRAVEKDSFINDKDEEDQDQDIMDQESQRELQEQDQNKEQEQQDSYEGEQDEEDDPEQNQSQDRENSEIIKDQRKQKSLQPVEQLFKIDKIDEMCSYEEFKERLDNFQQNNRDPQSKLKLDTSRSFSVFQINKRTNKPDYNLALKRFRRSADHDENKSDEVKDKARSVKGLMAVMNHINKEIIDSDRLDSKYLAFPMPPNQPSIEFMHIYDFLWDRMREMIKDITRLSDNEITKKPVIIICQQIARFFILAINEGRKQYNSKLKFVQRMNQESLTKILTPLMEIYLTSRMKLKAIIENLLEKQQTVTVEMVEQKMEQEDVYISPNQPEISSYALILSNDIRQSLYQKIFVGFDIGEDNPLFYSQEVQTALMVQKAISSINYHRYFEILENPRVDYVMSCMILYHLQTMRVNTADMIFKSYKCKTIQRKLVPSTVPTNRIRQALRFKQHQDEHFEKFIGVIGAEFDDQQGLVEKKRRPELEGYENPPFDFDENKLERDFYTTSKPPKLVFQPQAITRGQLITRSWKHSDYLKSLISHFLGKKYEIEQPKKVTLASYNKNVEPAQEQKATSFKKTDLDSMRAVLKKQNLRKTFLNLFTKQLSKIYQICLGDQKCKQKSVSKIMYILREIQSRWKKFSFHSIFIVGKNKVVLKSTFQGWKSVNKITKNFNRLTAGKSYQFTSHNKYITPDSRPMVISNVLRQKSKNTTIDNIFIEIAQLFKLKETHQNFNECKANGVDSLNLIIFVNQELCNEEQMILRNIWSYITNERMTESLEQFCLDPNERQQTFSFHIDYEDSAFENGKGQVLYNLKVMKIDPNTDSIYECLPPDFNFYKEDGVILFQVEDELDPLLIYFDSFKQRYQRRIQKVQPLKVPIVSFKFRQRNFNYYDQVQLRSYYSKLSLQMFDFKIATEAYDLSVPFRVRFKDFLAKTIKLKRRIPQIEVRQMSDVIKEIFPILKKSLNSLPSFSESSEKFSYFTVFVNSCLESVGTFNQICFGHPELIPNWQQIINSIISEKTMTAEDQSINYAKTTIQEKQFLSKIFDALPIRFIEKCFDKRHNFEKRDLLHIVLQYMSYFDSAKEEKDVCLNSHFQDLNVCLGKVHGQCESFFKWLLNKLSKYLGNVTVVMPKRYRYRIDALPFMDAVKNLQMIQSNRQFLMERKYQLATSYVQDWSVGVNKQMPGWVKFAALDVLQESAFLIPSNTKKRIISSIITPPEQRNEDPMNKIEFKYGRQQLLDKVIKKVKKL